VPAWWLNLQADPTAEVLAERKREVVRARRATDTEDDMVWDDFARLNPGFAEYRTSPSAGSPWSSSSGSLPTDVPSATS
jgi:F420H(2)-dependent quinone reductase